QRFQPGMKSVPARHRLLPDFATDEHPLDAVVFGQCEKLFDRHGPGRGGYGHGVLLRTRAGMGRRSFYPILRSSNHFAGLNQTATAMTWTLAPSVRISTMPLSSKANVPSDTKAPSTGGFCRWLTRTRFSPSA